MEELPVLLKQVQDADVKDQRLEKLAMRLQSHLDGKVNVKG
jgi:hypothetical protein